MYCMCLSAVEEHFEMRSNEVYVSSDHPTL